MKRDEIEELLREASRIRRHGTSRDEQRLLIGEMSEAIVALQTESERLREAAVPFAKFGETLSQMGGNTPKSGPWHTVVSREGEATIGVEDFNRIRAALNKDRLQ